jgi:hypothetical protein
MAMGIVTLFLSFPSGHIPLITPSAGGLALPSLLATIKKGQKEE